MNRCLMVAILGLVAALSSLSAYASDTLIVGDFVESTTGGFKFPDGTTQTTAFTGGTVGGISLTSPDGSITVGGTSVAPTVELNLTQTDALYAPAAGSPNYVAKTGATMTGGLIVNVSSANGITVTHTGTTGLAGDFRINNVVNSSNALNATTNGAGFAGNFVGNVNVTGNVTAGGNVNVTGNVIAASFQGKGSIPAYSSSGTVQPALHMVTGTVTGSATGVVVSLTGAAAFSSTGSYICMGSTLFVTSPTQVWFYYAGGNSFNLYCNTTTTVNYICIGS